MEPAADAVFSFSPLDVGMIRQQVDVKRSAATKPRGHAEVLA